jgi:hypothetical protein
MLPPLESTRISTREGEPQRAITIQFWKKTISLDSVFLPLSSKVTCPIEIIKSCRPYQET